MTYLDDAAIREQVWRAYNTRAASGEHDNRALMAKILELRNEKARLLGFRDFADLVLDDRMAHTGERAQNFLDDLRAQNRAALSRGESGAGGLRRPRSCEPWDVGYWAEKQRAALVRFRRRSAAAVFSAGTRGVGNVRDLRPHPRHSRRPKEQGVPAWDPEVTLLRDSRPRQQRAISARSTPTGIRAKTSAAARGWIR